MNKAEAELFLRRLEALEQATKHLTQRLDKMLVYIEKLEKKEQEPKPCFMCGKPTQRMQYYPRIMNVKKIPLCENCHKILEQES